MVCYVIVKDLSDCYKIVNEMVEDLYMFLLVSCLNEFVWELMVLLGEMKVLILIFEDIVELEEIMFVEVLEDIVDDILVE